MEVVGCHMSKGVEGVMNPIFSRFETRHIGLGKVVLVRVIYDVGM